jgi:hypothetical protein
LVSLAIGAAPLPSGAADFDADGYADLAVGVPGEAVGAIAGAGATSALYGSAGGIAAGGDQIWDQDDLGAGDPAEEDDAFGTSLAAGDFDGDGRADLAIGVPQETLGAAAWAGAVRVLYGRASSGLGVARSQTWHQDSPGVEGAAEDGDLFGAALATGDFDGDGRDDLAIGVRQEAIDGVGGAGAVNVLYGTAAGLSAERNQIWYEGHAGLGGTTAVNDFFGDALAAGDFDGDGYADLAVGISGENIGAAVNAGRVAVLYGSGSGLTAAGSQGWRQGAGGISDQAEDGDFFGDRLVTGDFDGDRFDDLVVGAPSECSATECYAGAVNVIYGSPGGLASSGNQFWTYGVIEVWDEYGKALAAADFNGDGRDDLAVGIPGKDLGDLEGAGAVEVLYGASAGLRRRPDNDFWHQDRSGMEDGAEAKDAFGNALAAADFDADGYGDLAVGINEEDLTTGGGVRADAGAVQILYGSPSGIAAAGNRFFSQDSPDVEGGAEAGDQFGYALAALPPERHWTMLPAIRR